MDQSMASPASSRIHLVGTCLSVACALHCLTVPFLLTVLPLAGVGVLLEGWLEVLFIMASWHWPPAVCVGVSGGTGDGRYLPCSAPP
jgi:hypothetical protein